MSRSPVALKQLGWLALMDKPPQQMSTFTQIQHTAANLLGAGLSLSINRILLAAHHGLGIDHIGLVAWGAGEGPCWHFFTCPGSSLLGATAAVDALAVQGCLVLCPAPHLALPQRAPGWFTVEVGLTPAALDVLHKAVVAASPGGAADSLAIVLAAPALHLAVRAVAPVLHIPLQGPVVQLVSKKTGDKKIRKGVSCRSTFPRPLLCGCHGYQSPMPQVFLWPKIYRRLAHPQPLQRCQTLPWNLGTLSDQAPRSLKAELKAQTWPWH